MIYYDFTHVVPVQAALLERSSPWPLRVNLLAITDDAIEGEATRPLTRSFHRLSLHSKRFVEAIPGAKQLN